MIGVNVALVACGRLKSTASKDEDMTRPSLSRSAANIFNLDRVHLRREHWRIELSAMQKHMPVSSSSPPPSSSSSVSP